MQNPPDAVSAIGMIDCPGTVVFATPPGTVNRGSFFEPISQRLFTVSGTQFSEVSQRGTPTNRGTVANDGLPASIDVNTSNQLLICSGGSAYWYDLAANVLHQLATDGSVLRAPAIMGWNCLDFFVVLCTDGTFQVSNAADATTWNDTLFTAVSEYPEHPLALISDHAQLLVPGPKRSVLYYGSGNTFPFDVVPGSLVGQGIAGSWAWAVLDNTTFMVMRDPNGGWRAVRYTGSTYSRISHDGIEKIFSNNASAMSQVQCWAYQESGHTFFAVWIPTAHTTLFYDVATGLWHERAAWDSTQGQYIPFRGINHVVAWNGMHLVGDTISGNLFQMSSSLYAYDTGPLIRQRQAPHINNENQYISFPELEILLESGQGPTPDLAGGTPLGPQDIVLKDANGGIWNLFIDDNGDPNLTAATVDTSFPLFLIDDQTGTTAWQIGVTTDGQHLTATQLGGIDPSFSRTFMMATPQNQQGILFVTAVGQVQTQVNAVTRGPQLMVQWSDDGGHTWSNIYTLDCGKAGKFKKRVRKLLMGTSRDRVFRITASDAAPFRIVDAYVQATGYQKPVQRLAERLRQQA